MTTKLLLKLYRLTTNPGMIHLAGPTDITEALVYALSPSDAMSELALLASMHDSMGRYAGPYEVTEVPFGPGVISLKVTE